MSKILLFTKVYDTEELTMSEIENSVQKDLDEYFEKPGMVRVKIDSIGSFVSYTLYREYSNWEEKDFNFFDSVRLEDCQFFTGHGCLDFRLPCPWGGTPYLNAMPMIVWLDEKAPVNAYKKSCKALGIDVPQFVSLQSEAEYFLAFMLFPGLKTKT